MLILAALAATALPASAQRHRKQPPPVDTTALVVIHRVHGKNVWGRVVAADDSSVSLMTLKHAPVTVRHDSIDSWDARPGTWTAAAGFRPADLATSRLFLGPTARTLKRGQGYFADYFIFIGGGGYAVHDRVLLSVGTGLMEDPEHHTGAGYLAVKVGIVQRRHAAFAVGAFSVSQRALNYSWSVGHAYGVLTLGSTDHAVTVMGGVPFESHSIARRSSFMVGGQTRVSGRLKLMTEVWKLPNTEVPAILGVRWIGNAFTLDVGEIHTFGNLHPGGPSWVPWVGVSIP